MLCDTWAVPVPSQGRAPKNPWAEQGQGMQFPWEQWEQPLTAVQGQVSLWLHQLPPSVIDVWPLQPGRHNQSCLFYTKWENDSWNHRPQRRSSTLPPSPAYTPQAPNTQGHLLREVNDTIAAFLGATVPAETILCISLLPLVLRAVIHKNNVWVHHGCVRWSQCPKAKTKEKLCWFGPLWTSAGQRLVLCSGQTALVAIIPAWKKSNIFVLH